MPGSGSKGAGSRRVDIANALWTMATTTKVMPEVFDSLCRAAAAKVQALCWAMAVKV